ncbi:ferredoxin--NADP reductase [Aliihoeflea aestuarii]|jgi:ferredoxin/flavodoxin---NADP+ reductase|uniref:ferredoxin--NADP reductase n=1 Tax=Aliihoeflea aestuarii TaxID=453840 RepID=UPI002092E5C0|nr:ferredoxin--NADP reductase [Aliihoeflea aestuarii]MCO6391167.1 ferredoxin--NADP reductase [Aliihoeflea aestuarii]
MQSAALAATKSDAPEFPVPANTYAETVVSVTHYTDNLFSFRITRPAAFRFRSGEFVMIGLPNAQKPVFRAYSIASPAWDEEVEFYSIKVPDGPLTQHLQKIQPGDTVLMKQKSTGTLVLDALKPGKRLWLVATGTGFAPWASLLRDPETYEKFDEVVVTNTCRDAADLAYGNHLIASLHADPLIGELTAGRVKYIATTTREPSAHMGRITTLIENGELFRMVGCAPFDPEIDRVMICGSMAMLNDVKALIETHGLEEGSNAKPADFVVERAFVG